MTARYLSAPRRAIQRSQHRPTQHANPKGYHPAETLKVISFMGVQHERQSAGMTPAQHGQDSTMVKTIRPGLRTLPARLATLAPRIGRSPGDERARNSDRDAVQPWRQWYKTARWQKLRWSILLRDLFTCRRCKLVEPDTSKLVADHITPHRGDERMFWDAANLQCLCKGCHDRVKQAEERRASF